MSCSTSRVWIAVLLAGACAACGKVGTSNGNLPDAAATGDGGGSDPLTRGAVKVTVLDPGGSGNPVMGAKVVFRDPDGTIVTTATTDIAGKASADVLPGGDVTSVVVNPSTASDAMQTVFAIKPGDDLVLGATSPDTSSAGTFNVVFPIYLLPTGAPAPAYRIESSCNAITVSVAAGVATGSAAIPITNDCKQSAMEIVAIAVDGNQNPIASLGKTGVKFADGGSVTLSGTYQPAINFTGTYSNINAIVTDITMDRVAPDGYGYHHATSTTPTTTATLTVPGAIASTAQVTTSARTAQSAIQLINEKVAATTAAYTMDLGASLLPWINKPTFDAATRKIVVPVDATGTSGDKPDLFRAAIAYSRTDAAGAVTSYSWALYNPELSDLTLPALPDDLAAIVPTAADTVRFTSTGVTAIEADAITSYDQVRNDLNAAFALYISQRPPGARVRVTRGLLR